MKVVNTSKNICVLGTEDVLNKLKNNNLSNVCFFIGTDYSWGSYFYKMVNELRNIYGFFNIGYDEFKFNNGKVFFKGVEYGFRDYIEILKEIDCLFVDLDSFFFSEKEMIQFVKPVIDYRLYNQKKLIFLLDVNINLNDVDIVRYCSQYLLNYNIDFFYLIGVGVIDLTWKHFKGEFVE